MTPILLFIGSYLDDGQDGRCNEIQVQIAFASARHSAVVAVSQLVNAIRCIVHSHNNNLVHGAFNHLHIYRLLTQPRVTEERRRNIELYASLISIVCILMLDYAPNFDRHASLIRFGSSKRKSAAVLLESSNKSELSTLYGFS